MYTDPADLACYSYDATRMSFLPDLVAEPATRTEVAALVRLCSQERIPIVPRGAATCQTGGPLPVSGGISLSLKLLHRILSIDPEARIAVVEPAVVNGDLQDAVAPFGLFYPPDPSSYRVSTIGGNIAECAGGPRCLKYGVTKDFVHGLEVVLPDGEIVDTGPLGYQRYPESALIGLVVGSEGTLGVVTTAYLRLLPIPPARRSVAATLHHIGQVGEVVHGVFSRGLVPSKMEFLDGVCLRLVDDLFRLNLDREAAALLLIEVDGEAEAVEEEITEIEATCRGVGVKALARARSGAEEEALWKARAALSPALSRSTAIKVNEDVVFPRGRLAEALQAIEELGRRYDLRIANYGHAGDGNLHTNFLLQDTREEKRRAEEALEELFHLVIRLEGSVAGEHGIGLTKVKYLAWELGEAGLKTMVRVRDVLNPGAVMNPYKIFLEQGGEALQRDTRLD